MSNLREAAANLLNALEASSGTVSIDQWVDMCRALRAALAEPQEPVAWGMRHSDGRIYDCIAPGEHDREPGRYTVPLYTHPPQRQPLTDEQIMDLMRDMSIEMRWLSTPLDIARAIEKAHGIGGKE